MKHLAFIFALLFTLIGAGQRVPNKMVLNSFNSITLHDILEFEEGLAHEKENLEEAREKAESEEDFLRLELQTQLILSAEKELENAKIFLASKEEKIAVQSRLILLLGAAAILFLLFLIFIYTLYRGKKEYARTLSQQNLKINQSIVYAERIQQSILPGALDIIQMLPKTAIFHQGLERVSGDFYWFADKGDLKIVAAVDCTGHGVPGAFMSLIGHTLMNHIVNEKNIVDPAHILDELNSGIVHALNQANNLEAAQDGMDIGIVAINIKTNQMEFAGAMSPVYIVRDSQVHILPGELRSIGGAVYKKEQDNFKFSKQIFQLKEDDSIFLFSDGYLDQFGEELDEKYNLSRFSTLLLTLAQLPFSERRNKMEETFLEWKGSVPQTDDILLMSISI